MKKKVLMIFICLCSVLLSAVEYDSGNVIFSQLFDSKIGILNIVEYPEETPPVYCLIAGEEINKKAYQYFRIYATNKELLIDKALDIKSNYDSLFVELKSAIDNDSRISDFISPSSVITNGIIYKYYYYIMK